MNDFQDSSGRPQAARLDGDNNQYVVGTPFRLQKTITVPSGDTNVELDVTDLLGLTRQIFFVIPDLDDSDTAELKLEDSDNYDLFTSGELAESTTHIINVERVMTGTITIRIECSGAQASDRDFVVTFYGLK